MVYRGCVLPIFTFGTLSRLRSITFSFHVCPWWWELRKQRYTDESDVMQIQFETNTEKLSVYTEQIHSTKCAVVCTVLWRSLLYKEKRNISNESSKFLTDLPCNDCSIAHFCLWTPDLSNCSHPFVAHSITVLHLCVKYLQRPSSCTLFSLTYS